jgi:hypothetical protein
LVTPVYIQMLAVNLGIPCKSLGFFFKPYWHFDV